MAQPLGYEDDLATRVVRAGAATAVTTGAAVRRGLAPREALGARLPFPARMALLAMAVPLLATGVVAMVRSGLGAGPGDVFLAALSARLDVAHGTAGMLFAVVLAAVATALRRRPGPGTLFLVLAVGPTVNLIWGLTPTPTAPLLQWPQFVFGLLLVAVGIGAAIQAAFGPGNIELITDGLVARGLGTHSRVRIGIEVTLGVTGLVLGGVAGAGVGTIVVALLIGPLVMLASSAWASGLVRWASPTAAPPLIPRLARASRL